jgi:hypothetical protein
MHGVDNFKVLFVRVNRNLHCFAYIITCKLISPFTGCFTNCLGKYFKLCVWGLLGKVDTQPFC